MITPIRVVFQSGETITAWSPDPDSFAQSVSDVAPPEIESLEYPREGDAEQTIPKLQEVTMTLRSGKVMICEIAESEVAKLSYIEEVEDYKESTTIAYARLSLVEADLDTRFNQVTCVINNLPNLKARLYCHKEYLKRKAAYVAACEAIVDSVIRSPEE